MKRQTLIVFTIAFMLLAPLPSVGILFLPETHTLEEQKPNRDNSISSTGWLAGFLFRKSLNITGSIGAGTDYQLMFDAYYDDGAKALSLDGNCQEDLDDVRFTDNDGITQLDYWTEHAPSGSEPYARFWVEVSDNLDTDQVIYIYYGNANAETTSNGEDTFLFFDDFENDDLNRWDWAGSDWSTVSDRVQYGSYSAFGDGGGTQDDRWLGTNSPFDNGYESSDIMIHMWGQRQLDTSRDFFVRVTNTTSGDSFQPLFATSGDDWEYYNDAVYGHWEEDTAIDDTWQRLELAVDFTNDLYRFWLDGVYIDSQVLMDIAGSNVTFLKSMELLADSGANEDMWIDDYYIRNYVFVEPSYSVWGEEEERPREWHSFTMEQVLFDLPGWNGFTMEDIIFGIPINVMTVSYWLMLGGLIMIPASTLLLVKGGRSEMSRDKLFLVLLMFLGGWALVLGGLM